MLLNRFQRRKPGAFLIAAIAGLLLSLPLALSASARDLPASASLCSASVGAFNRNFTTTGGLDASGNIPEDAGLIVHTIHGPGNAPTELNLKALNALTPDPAKTCGARMNGKPPVFLPWCGSNRTPHTYRWSDASSWSYIRRDTLMHGAHLQRPDEVVCSDADNKRYGLIFSNAYMNAGDNLGCMYPLDGDTGHRVKMGCGISQNYGIDLQDAQGRCPVFTDKAGTKKFDLADYQKDFADLLSDDGGAFASYAGSLICSLSKAQFDLWVGARKSIDLSKTAWPVDEFVLWNWDTYSTADLARNGYLVGIYYLTGCATTTDGTRAEAQAIADLYKKWSGVDLPVVNLSNAAMRAKGTTPFSCN